MEQTTLPARKPVPKFSNEEPYKRFYDLLSDRVETALAGQNEKGNAGTLAKAIVLISLYVFLVFSASFGPRDTFSLICIAILLGLLGPAIGFGVSHEAVHGSFSKSKAVNAVFAASFELLGCSSFFWQIKHNVIHHTFTNVDTYDDDLDIPWVRTHAAQPWQPKHRYQHMYCWFLYLSTYLAWVYKMDFDKYATRAIGQSPRASIKMSAADKRLFWSGKVWHPIMLLLLPMLMHGPVWILCYLLLASITGFAISIVFQIAHLVPQVEFATVPKRGETFEYSNKVHQIMHSADFEPGSVWLTDCLGGLNFQVEHHVFPEIHSRHYPLVQKILAETCAEWNKTEPEEWHVAYTCFPTMMHGLLQHAKLMKMLGKKPEESRKAA